MQVEPIDIARNDWGEILHHERWQTVELRWLPGKEMTDEGFEETLVLLAEAGVRLRPRFMIIDATEFRHQFGEGVMEWREQQIIPRYNEAGITRFAFIVPEGTPGTVESGGVPAPESGAHFPTGWFSTRERAYRWLGE